MNNLLGFGSTNDWVRLGLDVRPISKPGRNACLFQFHAKLLRNQHLRKIEKCFQLYK